RLDGPSGLRQAMLRYAPQFARSAAEKLLTYALGRITTERDMPVVRAIVRDAERRNYRFSDLILGVVKSKPFQMNMKLSEVAELRGASFGVGGPAIAQSMRPAQAGVPTGAGRWARR